MKVNVKDFVKSKGIKTAPLLALGAVMLLMGVAIGAFYQMFAADTQFAVRVQGIDGMFVQAGNFSNYDNKVPLTALAVQKYGVGDSEELMLNGSATAHPVALMIINDYDLDAGKEYALNITLVDEVTGIEPDWDYTIYAQFVQFSVVGGVNTISCDSVEQTLTNVNGVFTWSGSDIENMRWENSTTSDSLNCLAIAYDITPTLFSPTYTVDDISVAIAMSFGIVED